MMMIIMIMIMIIIIIIIITVMIIIVPVKWFLWKPSEYLVLKGVTDLEDYLKYVCV